MRVTKIILVVLVFSSLLACASAEVKQTPSTANNTAQDFTLTDQDGKLWTLGDVLKNHRGVVLAFYPKDDTGL